LGINLKGEIFNIRVFKYHFCGNFLSQII